MRLKGKVAIVTGAGSGMGKAMAELFCAEGASVVCADVSGREEDVARALGDAAVPVRVDVTRAEDVQRMVAMAVERFGRLDVLCNNAGIAAPEQRLHEIDEDLFDAVTDVNLKGVFLGMKYGIAAMLESGGGAIVNTASTAGLVGWKGNGAYGPSKAGVVLLTKIAAQDYAADNIRVNAICPGITWTGMIAGEDGPPQPPPGTPVPAGTPMERWGLPGEIAAAALFLASDEASFVTGTAVPVDGGYVAA